MAQVHLDSNLQSEYCPAFKGLRLLFILVILECHVVSECCPAFKGLRPGIQREEELHEIKRQNVALLLRD